MSQIATSWAIPQSSRGLFCPKCNSILKMSDEEGHVSCWECDYHIQVKSGEESEQVQVKTYKQDIALDDIHADPTTRRATVNEPCPNCKFHELTFYTQQMRSVDEAASVFFECSQCGYTFKQEE